MIDRFVKVLQHSQQLELISLDGHKTHIEKVNVKLNEVDIAEDQELFIDLNVRTFVTPDEWKFEPSPIHYDTVSISFGDLQLSLSDEPDNKADMNKEQTPKIVLQNKLRRSKEKLLELNNLINSTRE